MSTSPTQLDLVVDSGQMQLNWPADHIGWRLEAQTNALSVGLGINWVTVPGSAQTNQIVVPIARTTAAFSSGSSILSTVAV